MRDILVTDISRGGLRFFCGDQLQPGEVVRITLAEDQAYRMQIVWSQAIEPACFQVGANFVKQSAEA